MHGQGIMYRYRYDETVTAHMIAVMDWLAAAGLLSSNVLIKIRDQVKSCQVM